MSKIAVSTMFTCLQDVKASTKSCKDAKTDLEAVDNRLKEGLKSCYVQAIEDDDAGSLEEALDDEGVDFKPAPGKNTKKSTEDDSFSVLVRRIFHLACAMDALECCQLLLGPSSFSGVRVDAVNEVDGRSGLHFACLHHSKRCIKHLLKHGANTSLKSKQMMLPLEEALHSVRLHVHWDCTTPAAVIVEGVRQKDLSSIQVLGEACKEQLIPVASKLAKGLQVVPLISLLLTARHLVLNTVAKKTDSDTELIGTLVDLLLERIIPASSNLGKLVQIPSKVSAHAGGMKSIYRKSERETENKSRTNTAENKLIVDEVVKTQDRTGKVDIDGNAHNKINRTSGEKVNMQNTVEITRRKSRNEECMNSKYRLYVDGWNRSEGWRIEDRSLNTGNDNDCKIARKLLECVLLFSPRLSAHPQSSFLAPLIRAAQANDEALVALLLDSGAAVHESDSDGNTALHWAIRQARPANVHFVNIKVVQKLLDGGANVILGNMAGVTPVHTAAGHGHSEALSVMLEKDSTCASVMSAAKETPLHYAAMNNQMLSAALLMKHGANRNVCNLRNLKPCHLASSQEMYALLCVDDKTLKEHSWQSLAALFAAIQPLDQYVPGQHVLQSQSTVQCPPRIFSSLPGAAVPSSQALVKRGLQPGQRISAWTQCCMGQNQVLTPTFVQQDHVSLKTRLCKNFENCQDGEKCKFSHGTGGRPPTASSLASSSATDDSDAGCKIFVGGLPPFVTSADLREEFEAGFGKVVDAIVISSIIEGVSRSRGFGFVVFDQLKSAVEARRRHRFPVNGKIVEIKKCVAYAAPAKPISNGSSGTSPPGIASHFMTPESPNEMPLLISPHVPPLLEHLVLNAPSKVQLQGQDFKECYNDLPLVTQWQGSSSPASISEHSDQGFNPSIFPFIPYESDTREEDSEFGELLSLLQVGPRKTNEEENRSSKQPYAAFTTSSADYVSKGDSVGEGYLAQQLAFLNQRDSPTYRNGGHESQD